MKQRLASRISRWALFGLFILTASAAVAATFMRCDWFTVDGGGGRSAGGAYELTGTIGQPEVGLTSGGAYELRGGFWVEIPPAKNSAESAWWLY